MNICNFNLAVRIRIPQKVGGITLSDFNHLEIAPDKSAAHYTCAAESSQTEYLYSSQNADSLQQKCKSVGRDDESSAPLNRLRRGQLQFRLMLV